VILCERWGRLEAYRRGDIGLINELADGWTFYSGVYQLPETERSLTASQAAEIAKACMGAEDEWD